MKNFILFIALCISAKSFGGIYEIHDNENQCTLLFSQDSAYSKEIDITKLERRSISAAVVFQKLEGKFNVKGLWSFVPLTTDVKLEKESIKEFMSHTFKSVCINEDKEIVHSEKGRKLFNDFNDLDKE